MPALENLCSNSSKHRSNKQALIDWIIGDDVEHPEESAPKVIVKPTENKWHILNLVKPGFKICENTNPREPIARPILISEVSNLSGGILSG
jgi:hypothetical protein